MHLACTSVTTAKIGAACPARSLHFLCAEKTTTWPAAPHAVQGQALFNGGERVGINLDHRDTGKLMIIYTDDIIGASRCPLILNCFLCSPSYLSVRLPSPSPLLTRSLARDRIIPEILASFFRSRPFPSHPLLSPIFFPQVALCYW